MKKSIKKPNFWQIGNSIRKQDRIKKLIKEMQKGTFIIRKKGKKYLVKDVVDFQGDYGLMTEKEILERFGV